MKKKENKRKKGEKVEKIEDDKGDKKEKTVRTKCDFSGRSYSAPKPDLKNNSYTTIRTLLKQAIKCVHWHNGTHQVSRIFTSVDAFSIFTYPLLYVCHTKEAGVKSIFLVTHDKKWTLPWAPDATF